MKIAVAMSGGVDSLCALISLWRAGHEVFGLHARLADIGEAAHAELEAGLLTQCAKLGIALEVVDLRQDFAKEVIRPFVDAYAAGGTPNPCGMCNRDIKFGLLLECAIELGAEKLATGHYARLSTMGEPRLGLAKDLGKDQSYFMALARPACLEFLCFPLGELTKDDSRRIVREAGNTAPLRRESQDICFLPGGDYRALLSSRLAQEPGAILLRDARGEKFLGNHSGLWRYTEGQRKGLGVAHSEPLYVLEKDARRNALILGARDFASTRSCLIELQSVFVPLAEWPDKIFVKLRSTQKPMPCSARATPQGLETSMASGQLPLSPGQIGAFYDAAGWLLAGGLIKAPSRA